VDYPLFDVPRLGAGMLIALVSIFHVVIAHISVGTGIFLGIAHTLAVKRNDQQMLGFLKSFSIYFILLSLVAGAVSGVGIWVTIGLGSPPATSALIHMFVWGWAIEWVFFIVEIVAAYIYYYGWYRLTPRRHVAVAWIYAISAYMSLVVINGIVAFMLTTGDWQPPQWAEDVSPVTLFWTGFFNPSYWSQLVLRTVSSLALAGLFLAMVVNIIPGYDRDEKRRLINIASYMLAPIGLMGPAAIWYFAVLPEHAQQYPLGGSIAMTMFLALGLVASVFIALYAYFGLIKRKMYISGATALLLFGLAFIATGSMEFMREGVRKPYLIYGYMYSNGIIADEKYTEEIDREGVLAHARFAYPPGMTLEQAYDQPLHVLGEYVYNAQCRICHTPHGTNAIGPLINQASRDWLMKTTEEQHRIKLFMPPFHGTEKEKRAVVEYLYFLGNPEAFESPTTQPSRAGRFLYDDAKGVQ
jgi:cytochrome bd-type quinol oxidase subunit 1